MRIAFNEIICNWIYFWDKHFEFQKHKVSPHHKAFFFESIIEHDIWLYITQTLLHICVSQHGLLLHCVSVDDAVNAYQTEQLPRIQWTKEIVRLLGPNVRCWSQQRGDRGLRPCGLSCSQTDNVCSHPPSPALLPPSLPPTSTPSLRAIWDVWESRGVKLERWRSHWPM